MDKNEGRGGSTPNSELWLLSCPELSPGYGDTWRFDTKEEQTAYFKSKVELAYKEYSYLRKDNAIKVHAFIDQMYGFNYLMYKNRYNRWYYCFILDKEYVNENTTILHIQTDLIQTFWFDFKLEPSYVERCHVPRWAGDGKPAMEIEPEGLEFGDHVQISRKSLYTYKDNFLVVASNPLGVIENRPDRGTGGGGSATACGDWEKGIISNDCFRFIKGQEGWSPSKHNVLGQYVIAYGITPDGEKDVFNLLDKNSPLNEPYGAKINYETINKNYGNSNNFGMNTVEYFKKVFHVDSQNKFDALIDLFYNTGQGSLISGSLHDALRDHPNNENIIRPIWEKHWASQSPHIRARRKAECDIYFGKGYKIDPINVYNANGVIVGTLKDNDGNGWLPDCKDPLPPTTCKIDYKAYNLDWTYPVHGTVTSKFPKYSDGRFHSGTDIGCPLGTPVYATRDLYIEKAGKVLNDQGQLVSFGIYIKAQVIGTDYKVWYAHLSKHKCKTGDTVKCGQIIGYSGNTGHSFGPHLHYEMRKKPWNYTADCIDPIPSIKVNDKI